MESVFNLFFIGVDLYLVFKNIQLMDWIYQDELPPGYRPPPIQDLTIFPTAMELRPWVSVPHYSKGELETLNIKFPTEPRDMAFFTDTLIEAADAKATIGFNADPPEGAIRFQFRGKNLFEPPETFYFTSMYEVDRSRKNAINY